MPLSAVTQSPAAVAARVVCSPATDLWLPGAHDGTEALDKTKVGQERVRSWDEYCPHNSMVRAGRAQRAHHRMLVLWVQM